MEPHPPESLLRPVPAADRAAVLRWWAALPAAARGELAALYDGAADAGLFGAAADAPAVTGGRFLPHDDAWGYGEWADDWREHLTEHGSDVFLMSQPPWRTFFSPYFVADWRRVRVPRSLRPPSERF